MVEITEWSIYRGARGEKKCDDIFSIYITDIVNTFL